VSETALQERYQIILPHLNERQQRLIAAVDARALGYGGVTKVHRLTGMSRRRIYQGLHELEAEPFPADRSRRAGGGRKKVTVKQPNVAVELDKLIEPSTRGHPETTLRWTTKNLRDLARILVKKGYQISHVTVRKLLKGLGYSLQANSKTREGETHEDRDQQFEYINNQATEFIAAGDPVVSVDTKKKELVGNYKNNGREWQMGKQPVEVNMHDFPDKNLGKAIPYGVYDIGQNEGWVNVGITRDTAAFATESLRRWWWNLGRYKYPHAKKLLITADSGGSNARRSRLWKKELQQFSDEAGLEITVCHFPPGTSKWNKIEHRLFCHISMNWRGRPLVNLETIINLIGSTKTKTGLKVYAMIDKNDYPKGVKVSDQEFSLLNLRPHEFHGEWNYTIKPCQ